MLPFLERRFFDGMVNAHFLVRSVQRNNQIAALEDFLNRSNDQNAFSVIFLDQQRQSQLIKLLRLAGRFFHLRASLFGQSSAGIILFQKADPFHALLERFQIGRFPLHDDFTGIELWQIIGRNPNSLLRELRDGTFVPIKRKTFIFVLVLFFQHEIAVFALSFRRLGCDLRIGRFGFGDRRFRNHRLHQVAVRIKTEARILPDLNRNLREVSGVLVTLLNERRRKFIESTRTRLAGSKVNSPHDVVGQGKRTETSQHDFDQFAQNAPLLLRSGTANDSLHGCRRFHRSFRTGNFRRD